MARIVTCVNCKEKFDREKIECIEVGYRRYAHKTCLGDTYSDIVSIAKDWLGDSFNATLVSKQIKQYCADGYSENAILKILNYIIKIKCLSKDGARGGIGILPYLREEAYEYYRKMEDINNSISSITRDNQERIVTISSPKPHKKYIELEDL